MPKLFNAVSEKAQRELLCPAGPKNRAARGSTLKHEPMLEYRNSVYRYNDDLQETRLCIPATAFKGALLSAALRMPGVMKTEIGQLVYIRSLIPSRPDHIPVFGIPQMSMMVVRNADAKRVPDIRTRAILPAWCCAFRMVFTPPLLTETTCINLLGWAGMISGVGDFRQEKGKGSYGVFEIVSPGDALWKEIASTGGRAAQDAALEEPDYYDDETMRLHTWFVGEVSRRGRDTKPLDGGDSPLRQQVAAATAKRRRNGEAANVQS